MLRCSAILGLFATLAAASPPPATIYATRPGLQTRDSASDGGNPFASAFIELLARPDLDLSAFASELAVRTERLSDGFQKPDLPSDLHGSNVRLGQAGQGERRVALVLVLSDYSFGLASLPGAQRDAIRVAEALRRAGFDTRLVLDPERGQIGPTLANFAARSAEADTALIYATGHGIEVDGIGYLLNRDFPALLGHHALATYAVPLARIAASAQARTANLLFYAGCRDDPFGS